MQVNKVIVHRLDANERRMVIADKQLNLNTSRDIEDLIMKVTKTFQTNPHASPAEINEDSNLHNIIGGMFDFIQYSSQFARTWFSNLMLGGAYTTTNLIMAVVEQGDMFLLVCLEMANKSAYIKDEEDYVHNNTVLNATFASVKNGFVLDLEDGILLVKTSEENKELMESALDCEIKLNSFGKFDIVIDVVDKLSELRGESKLLNKMKLKQVITDNQNFVDSVYPSDIVNAVFDNLSQTEINLVSNVLEENHAKDYIVMKDLKRSKIASKHTIVTESGIVISIPIDSVDINRVLSINANESHEVNISLNNVGNIIE